VILLKDRVGVLAPPPKTDPRRQDIMPKKKFSLGCALFFSFCFLLAPGGPAQVGTKKITYEQAFQNKEPHILKSLPPASWLDDENFLLREEDEKTRATKLFKVSARTGARTLFVDYAAFQEKLPQGFAMIRPEETSPDYSTFVYSFRNDLYLYSLKTQGFKRLTATPEEEKTPRFSPDTKHLAYTRSHNLYALDLETGLEHQLTTDGSETIYNGWASWVYYEEILGRRSRYAAFWWAPDSRRIAFLRFDDSPVPVFPIVRSTEVHAQLERERYPQPGDSNPRVKLGVVSLPDATITWADLDENADHYVAWPFWLPDGSGLTFQWMNREQDDIKIFGLDLQTGKKQEIYNENQPSWVEFFEDLYFFKDGSGFLLRSDVSGWRRRYYYDLKGNLKAPLTQGDISVDEISLVDEDNSRVYFAGRKQDTLDTHLFRVGLDGNNLEQLTRESGTHRTAMSPGGRYFLDTFTNVDTPARRDLYRSDGSWVRKVDQSQTPELEDYPLGKKELFTVPAGESLALPGSWILPPGFDPNGKYPVLFMIYGGPGSSDVTNSFPRLSAFYLAQEGIIVFSVDHRGSGYFGKKGTSLMYRNLGKWEMHDYIEAVKWLRQKPFIDSTRIGITGGSYGGYATCMALTYGADYFTHGYAQFSVTDWRLYDSVYTERYMDKPEENEAGYEFGSALTHAGKLKGVFVLEHGDMDDNVHMQNSIQLINALMDEGKMFEFVLYPDQRHGFRGRLRDYSSRRFVDFWLKDFLNR
jgi:dipeptidyl-peptidase-4